MVSGLQAVPCWNGLATQTGLCNCTAFPPTLPPRPEFVLSSTALPDSSTPTGPTSALNGTSTGATSNFTTTATSNLTTTATTTLTSTTTIKSLGIQLSPEAIAGISVASIVILIAIAVFIFLYCKYAGNNADNAAPLIDKEQGGVALQNVRKGTLILSPPSPPPPPPSPSPDKNLTAPISQESDLTPVESSAQMQTTTALPALNSQPSKSAPVTLTKQPEQGTTNQPNQTKKRKKLKKNQVSPNAPLPPLSRPGHDSNT